MTQHFPTCPAYLVPVEIKETPQYGKGHKGVFATEPIAKGTKMWVWTDRVTSIHHDDLEDYIATNFGTNLDKIRVFLQQGFVLPPSSSSETLSLPQQSHNNDAGNEAEPYTTITPTSSSGSGSSSGNSNSDDDFFHSNPTDSGRLTNHSSVPNTGPEGALRDILPGEELTIDYSFHGNPEWYRTICAKYGVETEAQVAASCQS